MGLGASGAPRSSQLVTYYVVAVVAAIRVGEITGTKMAEYRQITGYLPYVQFYVELYQIVTSWTT